MKPVSAWEAYTTRYAFPLAMVCILFGVSMLSTSAVFVAMFGAVGGVLAGVVAALVVLYGFRLLSGDISARRRKRFDGREFSPKAAKILAGVSWPFEIKYALLRSKNCPDEVWWEELDSSLYSDDALQAALNKYRTDELLTFLLEKNQGRGKETEVWSIFYFIEKILSNKDCPREMFDFVVTIPREHEKEYLWKYDSAVKARIVAVENPSCPPEVLLRFALECESLVRDAVLKRGDLDERSRLLINFSVNS